MLKGQRETEKRLKLFYQMQLDLIEDTEKG